MSIARRNIAVDLGQEIIAQRKAYLCQADAVVNELCRLASVCDRTLGFLTNTEADVLLLDAIQQKANDILVLQRQLRELWGPLVR